MALRNSLLLILAAVLFVVGARPGRAGRAHPNVLLIVTDDQGWGDLRCHGNGRIETPVLDRLAGESVRFDRFYVSPVCAPTRASLLTGRWHLRTGVCGVTRGLETMRAEEVTLAEALKGAGYRTGCFGKWHNGAHYPNHPNGQGFEEFFGFCAGHWNNYFDTELERNGEPVRTHGYITEVLTDAALRFVEQNRSRPFLCYVPFNAPHGPFQVPDRFYEKYARRGLDEKTAAVYAMVACVDENIGRLLRRLDELDLAKDTVVLFMTDNGPNGERYNGGMRGTKGSVHEGGIRVPLFVRWTGRLQPRLVDRIAAHVDLFPTLLELCGVPEPKGEPRDGRSLVPLLEGRAAGWPDRLLFTHQARGEKVALAPGSGRSQRYRLVRTERGVELYDMDADPGQKRDLAAEQPEKARELSRAYEAWFADVTRRPLERPAVPVGYAQAPRVELPAPEAYFSGGVRFQGRAGWANDWLTGWSSPEDRIWWELDVTRGGRYAVELRYTCPAGQTGSRVRLEVGGQALEGTLDRAHDPTPLPSPDRVPRTEVYEKEWATLDLGELPIPAGRTRLTLRALSMPGSRVMDLKAVRLRRVGDGS